MSTQTMALYWRVITYGSIAGVALSVSTFNLYYLIFATDYTLQSFADAAKWGALVALATSGFVISGTIVVGRRLETRRGKAFFIALSAVTPVLGWLLLGILNGLFISWIFFVGFPLIAAASGVLAGIIAALAMFFVPQADVREQTTVATDPFSVFDERP